MQVCHSCIKRLQGKVAEINAQLSWHCCSRRSCSGRVAGLHASGNQHDRVVCLHVCVCGVRVCVRACVCACVGIGAQSACRSELPCSPFDKGVIVAGSRKRQLCSHSSCWVAAEMSGQQALEKRSDQFCWALFARASFWLWCCQGCPSP